MSKKKTEANTRKERIDPKVQLAGRDLGVPSPVIEDLGIDLVKAGVMRAAEPRTLYGGHQFSDYSLLLKGKPAAVIEAKKTAKDAQPGKKQAVQSAFSGRAKRSGVMRSSWGQP